MVLRVVLRVVLMSFVETTDGSSEPLAREGPAEEEHEDAPPARQIDWPVKLKNRFARSGSRTATKSSRSHKDETYTWPAEAFNS